MTIMRYDCAKRWTNHSRICRYTIRVSRSRFSHILEGKICSCTFQALLRLIRACDEQLKEYPSDVQKSDPGQAGADDSDSSPRLVAKRTAERLLALEQRAVTGARTWLLRQLRAAKETSDSESDSEAAQRWKI